MNDFIVDEVRRVRDAYAARFNYDLHAIFQDIKEREKKSGLKFVEGVAQQPVAKQPVQSVGTTADSRHETRHIPGNPRRVHDYGDEEFVPWDIGPT